MEITIISIKGKGISEEKYIFPFNSDDPNIIELVSLEDRLKYAHYLTISKWKEKSSVEKRKFSNYSLISNRKVSDLQEDIVWDGDYKYRLMPSLNDNKVLIFSKCLETNIDSLRKYHYKVLIDGLIKKYYSEKENIFINIIAHKDDFNKSNSSEIIPKNFFNKLNLSSKKLIKEINAITFSHDTNDEMGLFNEILKLVPKSNSPTVDNIQTKYENLINKFNSLKENKISEQKATLRILEGIKTQSDDILFKNIFYQNIDEGEFIKHIFLETEGLKLPHLKNNQNVPAENVREYILNEDQIKFEKDNSIIILHSAYYSYFNFFGENMEQESLMIEPLYKYFYSNIAVSYHHIHDREKIDFNTILTKKEDIDIHHLRLNVVKEYAEFHQRKFKMGYLKAFEGGHSAQVTPFQFHSEDAFKKKCKKQIEDIINNKFIQNWLKAKKVKPIWRIVLCDDYSERKLNAGNGKSELTKKQVIEKIFNEFEGFNDIIELKTSSSIKNLISSETNSADIILLDYLFNNDHENEVNSTFNENCKCDTKNLHYGTDFFELLKDSKEEEPKISESKYFKLNQAPFNKYWVIPISSFSKSMRDNLQNKGISTSDSDFEMARGACPINTPYLFLYELLFMMNQQLSEIEVLFEGTIEKKIEELIFDEKRKIDWVKEFNEITKIILLLKRLEVDKSTSKFAKAITSTFINLKQNLKNKLFNHWREYSYQKAFHSPSNNEILAIEKQKIKMILQQLDHIL